METENLELTSPVNADSQLKELIIDYIGTSHNQEVGGEVTVAMIVETMSREFPEFLLAVAEENWIRGYHQALTDVADGEKILREIEENEQQDEE